jgi:NifU-like protein involved in Fe-S cluster formation
MWDYTDTVMDHFRNPRNVGKIEHPDGVGTVGALACGDALTLMFKLGPDGRIAEVKFQTFGCASAIASVRSSFKCKLRASTRAICATSKECVNRVRNKSPS